MRSNSSCIYLEACRGSMGVPSTGHMRPTHDLPVDLRERRCEEKIRSCKFKILNAQLADDVVLRGGGSSARQRNTWTKKPPFRLAMEMQKVQGAWQDSLWSDWDALCMAKGLPTEVEGISCHGERCLVLGTLVGSGLRHQPTSDFNTSCERPRFKPQIGR